MKQVWQFVVSGGKLGISLMTGGLASFLLAAYEHVSRRSIAPLPWTLIAVVLFMAGAFLAWDDQYQQTIEARNAADASRPRLTLLFLEGALEYPTNYFCVVSNFGGRTAFDVDVSMPPRGDYAPVFLRLQFVQPNQPRAAFCNVQYKGELHKPASTDGTYFAEMLRFDYTNPSDQSDIWIPVRIAFSDNSKRRINTLNVQVTRPEMFVNVGDQVN